MKKLLFVLICLTLFACSDNPVSEQPDTWEYIVEPGECNYRESFDKYVVTIHDTRFEPNYSYRVSLQLGNVQTNISSSFGIGLTNIVSSGKLTFMVDMDITGQKIILFKLTE